ncbi:hypothetical protein RLIN73S_00338 [Rhodanobacter lindaniclasticus]
MSIPVCRAAWPSNGFRAYAEVGGDVAGYRHAGRLQVRFDARVEQQALQRRQLSLLGIELPGEPVDAGLQRRQHGVASAAGVLDAADGGRLVEVELAVELAHLHQTLAERIQAGRLRLQLAQLDRQRVQAALRVDAHATKLGVLLADLPLQVMDLRQRAVARTGDGQGEHRRPGSGTRARPATPPKTASSARAGWRDPRVLGSFLARETSMLLHVFPKSNVGTMHRAESATSRRRDNGPKSLADCGSFASLARKARALERWTAHCARRCHRRCANR